MCSCPLSVSVSVSVVSEPHILSKQQLWVDSLGRSCSWRFLSQTTIFLEDQDVCDKYFTVVIYSWQVTATINRGRRFFKYGRNLGVNAVNNLWS